MTTNHHTALAFGGPLTAAAMEAPLGQLDAAIAAVIATGSGASTTLTAQAAAGQASLVVASSAGFLVGDPIYIGTGTTFESRIVGAIPDGTHITVTVNLTNTYAIGKPVSKSPVEIVDARAGFTTLGGRVVMIESRSVDVRLYGAVGDGVTDDTAAIQAAITAAGSGGRVILPRGTYKVSDMLTITAARVQLEGFGATLTQVTNTTTILEVTGDNVTVAGIRFVQTGTSGTPVGTSELYGAGVAFRSCSGGAVLGCVFESCGTAAGAGAAVWFTGTTGCRAVGNRVTGGGMAINTDAFFGASGGNLVADNEVEGSYRGYVLDLQGANVATNKGDIVRGNTFRSVTNRGIEIDSARNGFSVEGNRIVSPGEYGISLAHQCSYGAIRGNLVTGGASHGMALNHLGEFIGPLEVSGNTVTGCAFIGIAYYGVFGGVFANNLIKGNGTTGILSPAASYSRNVVIADNVIAENGHDGIDITDGSDCVIKGNAIYGNGTVLANTYDGIVLRRVNVDPKGYLIANNLFEMTFAPSAKPRYCINFTAAFGAKVLILGNIFGDFVTANRASAWGGETVADNVG
ncbi:MAG: right-handed parallel beta-helix repeat-containing protein [Chloroflexota bacterium]